MLRLYAWYAFSGFLALGYQVVWFRTFVDAFGSTNRTFAFVLVNFIGGLGAGSLVSRPLSTRLGRLLGRWFGRWFEQSSELRCYGWIEIGVAVTAAAGLFLPQLGVRWFGPFPYAAGDGGVFQPLLLPSLVQLAVSVACVFVPCFLMGVTFPLLCSAFRRHARLPAALYAWNTAGAASGILVCEFVLLPTLGHTRLHQALVLANLAFGVWFASGRGARGAAANSSPAAATPQVELAPGLLLGLSLLSGLLTGAFEADALRRLQFLDCRTGAALSCISFWAVVAIFAGSAAVRVASWLRLRHIQLATTIALAVYLLTWHFAYPLRDWANHADNLRVRAALPPLPPGLSGSFQFFDFGYSAASVLWFTGLVVFPPFFLLSLALPYACNAAQAGGRHLGRLYGGNTLAFCLGLVAFSTLVPRVNLFYAMRLFIVLFALAAAYLWSLRAGGQRSGARTAAAAAGVAIAAWLTPTTFAPQWFPPGSPAATLPVRAMRSDGAHTTYVVADPAGAMLYFDSHPMSGCNAIAQQYMRLMAHFPLLMHPHPTQALLICFGVGSTASAIASHRCIEHLDVVDLNDQVFATAPEFAANNRNVVADPRVRLIHDDGRRFLSATDQLYDLITSEPPPPMFAGVARLYSSEYYRDAKAHLRPGGTMTQWLPTDQMPRRVMRAAIRSFVDVFPDCLLFVGADTNFILLGCNGTLRLPEIEARFQAEPDAAADLAPFGIERPLDLLVRIVQSGPELARGAADAESISDQHNLMSLVFHDPAAPPLVTYDPAALRAGLTGAAIDSVSCRAEWEYTLSDLGRLKTRVPDFPESTLQSVRAVATAPVAGANVEWPTIKARLAAADRALANGRADDAIAQLEQARREAPSYALPTRRLGETLLRAGRFEPALELWRGVHAADPNDPGGLWAVAFALLQLGHGDQALAELDGGIARFPREAALHRLRGDVLGSLARHGEAVRAYDRALELAPNDPATKAARERSANAGKR